jgi:RNA polymerase sigma-70 factor (family 1)
MSTDTNRSNPAPEDRYVQWARRLRESDHGAFTALFKDVHVPLLRYAWRYTGGEEAARDVVQDALLKLWNIRETLDPYRSLKALLYTMVRNLALNHQRAGQNMVALVEAEAKAALETDDVVDAAFLSERIRDWVDQMPERRREAFLLSRFHGMSHEEIAQTMNLTATTVNTHIVLALRTLRERLRQLEKDLTLP